MSDDNSGSRWRILWFSKTDAIETVYDRTDWDWQRCESWLDAQIAAGALPELDRHFDQRVLRRVYDAIDRELRPEPTDSEVENVRAGLVQMLRTAIQPEPDPIAAPVQPACKPVPEKDLRDWIERNFDLSDRVGVPLVQEELQGTVSREPYRQIRREIAEQRGVALRSGRKS